MHSHHLYCLYGQSLDNKAPLLKALTAVDKAASEVCQYFDKNVTKVVATLGWEQEYFLVDKALYNARPDLSQTGRALLGAAPAKGSSWTTTTSAAFPPCDGASCRSLSVKPTSWAYP